MSADGILIKVQRQDNYHGGDPDFWATLCRRALVENRAVAIAREPAATDTGAAAGLRTLAGVKDVAGKPFGYLLGIYVTDSHVYTFEIMGPEGRLRPRSGRTPGILRLSPKGRLVSPPSAARRPRAPPPAASRARAAQSGRRPCRGCDGRRLGLMACDTPRRVLPAPSSRTSLSREVHRPVSGP